MKSDPTSFVLIVRTPHENSFQGRVRSVRVPTETGHVGLRPRSEPTVLALEPGVVLAQSATNGVMAVSFIGTAGGLLISNTETVTLLTPIAVVGADRNIITEQLDALLQQPNSEFEARTILGKLQGHILSELRREHADGAVRVLT